jgi:dissimilatory sulfite reductase related protein
MKAKNIIFVAKPVKKSSIQSQINTLRNRRLGMAKATLGGTEIEIDEDGFIQEPDKWNKEVAEDIAKVEQAFPMGDDHWKLVNYLRDYYLKYEIAPPIRMLVKQTGIDLKTIYQLFPGGPAKGACKVAGLPKPTGCV